MEKSEKTPLKRDKTLVPLSREHHFGLLFCWKLRQGLKNGADLQQMRAYVRYFWDNILHEHCQEEEWLLRRLLVVNDTLRIRIEEEHRLLEAIIRLICDGEHLQSRLFDTLQQDLNDHIRWEERTLFPYLQTVADPEELQLAGKLLAKRHTSHTDDFAPEFWVNPVPETKP
ncbi:hemerythrin domain-containing protein [Pontibacter liquoris]|uniref:hemerythrin domain-containing protein n=1 Tax=Pontibacter liquoris TaxID=2905677 RepID=UPI001FA6C4D5|nr:hemerythrin domain-containing protein [Pontibacter liquoris]